MSEKGVRTFVVNVRVSFESGGGMGELDAIEEGLRAIIENPENPTRFIVESMSSATEERLVEYKEEKKPEVERPKDLTTVKFEMHEKIDADTAENVFELIMEDAADFKSAVSIGEMVRTVMYEKGAKAGTPIRMVTKGTVTEWGDKPTAWCLQQLIDWAYLKIVKVMATRRLSDTVVEVAYVKHGLAPPPPKEPYIMFLKKTDGWTWVKEPKR